MIEVRLTLHDADELALVHQLATILEGRRHEYRKKAFNARMGREPQPTPPEAHTPPQPEEPDHGEPEAQVVGSITPEMVTVHAKPAGHCPDCYAERPSNCPAHQVVTKPAPAKGGPTAAQMTEAVQTSINTIGVPLTREVLLAFGHGQVMKIEQDLWPAVLNALVTKAAK
jgi:hypothetical protein